MADLRGAGTPGLGALTEGNRTAQTARRFRRELLLVSAVVILLSIAAVHLRWFEVLDRLAFDTVLRLVPLPVSKDIILVGIDAQSLAEVGRWPWSRANQAKLIERVAAGEPDVVFIDIVYADRSDPADDARLIAAVAQAAPVAMPVVIDAVSPGGMLREYLPFPELMAVVDRLGHVHVAPDGDGIVRGGYLYEGIGEPRWPHVGLTLSGRAARAMPAECNVMARQSQGSLVNERCAYRRLRFAGPPGSFPHVSAADLLSGRVNPDVLEGSVVLIGRTDLGAPDAIPVPVSADTRPMAGVEYNANVLNALEHGGLVEIVSTTKTLFGVLFIVGIGLFVIPRQRPRQMLVAASLLALMPLPVSTLLLLVGGLWIDLSAASVAVALIYPLWSWRRNEMGWQFVGDELDRLATEAFRWSRSRARFEAGELQSRLAWLEAGTAMSPPSGLRGAIELDQAIGMGPNDTADPFVSRLLRIQTLAEEVRIGREVSMAGLDQMPTGLCIFVASGNVVLSNESFRAFAGISAPHTYFVADALAGFLDVAWQPVLQDVIFRGATRWLETRNVKAQQLLIRIAPLQVDGYAQPVCLLTTSDVTDIRKAQARREETLAFVSHDLRSPMSSILSIVRNPRLALDAGAMQRIEAYAQRSLKVSEEFVQLSRLENQMVLHHHEIDLVAVVENAVDQLYEVARDKSISVVFEPRPDMQVLWMLGDGELLERVFVNLLENAIKYSPAGRSVVVCIEDGSSDLLVTIKDEGYGIPDDEVARIFDPYFRSQATELAVEKGLGLGLRFVRTALELHGGQVTVASRYGEGSSFTVWLPASVRVEHRQDDDGLIN